MYLVGIQMVNASVDDVMMKYVSFYSNSYNPPALYQTRATGTTISWLSQAGLDCYLDGQAFLILQRKTLALLAAQQHMDGLAGRLNLTQAIRER